VRFHSFFFPSTSVRISLLHVYTQAYYYIHIHTHHYYTATDAYVYMYTCIKNLDVRIYMYMYINATRKLPYQPTYMYIILYVFTPMCMCVSAYNIYTISNNNVQCITTRDTIVRREICVTRHEFVVRHGIYIMCVYVCVCVCVCVYMWRYERM
jgi:hypothetical protein